jgi:hypothetical protein
MCALVTRDLNRTSSFSVYRTFTKYTEMSLNTLLQIVESALQENAPPKSQSLIHSPPYPYLSPKNTAPSRDGPQSYPNPSQLIPHHTVLARGNLLSVAHRSKLPIITLSKHTASGTHAALRECGLALRFGPLPPASSGFSAPPLTFVIRSIHEKIKTKAKKACCFVLVHAIYCTYMLPSPMTYFI